MCHLVWSESVEFEDTRVGWALAVSLTGERTVFGRLASSEANGLGPLASVRGSGGWVTTKESKDERGALLELKEVAGSKEKHAASLSSHADLILRCSVPLLT